MWQKVKALLFENRTLRQTVAKNAFWLAISNFGGRLLRAVIIIYAARVLGAAEWGVFSYAITLVAFLTVFIDLGVSPILVREFSKTADGAERARFFSTAFLMKTALLALGVLVVIFVAPKLTSIADVNLILPIIALILVFDVFRDFGFSILRAVEKMEREALLFLLINAGIVGFGFAFLALSPTVMSFTYAYAAGTAMGMVATFLFLRRYFRKILSSFTPSLVKTILFSAWPFAVANIFGILLINTDILLIGWFLGAEEVGLYSAGVRIIQLLYVFPAIIAVSVLPTFSRLAQRDNSKFRSVLEQVVKISFLAAIPLAIGGIITAQGTFALLFGKEFFGGVPAFQILLLTLLVNFPAVILSNAVFAYDRQRNLTIFAAIAGLGNVAFDLLLIPRFGIAGSAWATLAAQLISNAYLWSVMKRIQNFSVLPRLAKAAVAAVAMGVLAWTLVAVGVPVLLTIGLAGGAYVAFLLLFREPIFEEFKLILQSSASGAQAEGGSPAART